VITSEPLGDCGQDATRPIRARPHLLHVDAAVLHDKEAANRHETRKPAQRRQRRFVVVRAVLNHKAASLVRYQRGDLRGKVGIAHVASHERDVFFVAAVDPHEPLACGVNIDVDSDHARLLDAVVAREGSKPVSEPQRAAAELCTQFNHNIRARAPDQVLVDAQVLGELRDPQARVVVLEVLLGPTKPVVADRLAEPNRNRRRKRRRSEGILRKPI
jgi:hypothetical protein